ncbi:MAG: tetratricopeptide repeat protein [Deltaproteobacteria bacterium]
MHSEEKKTGKADRTKPGFLGPLFSVLAAFVILISVIASYRNILNSGLQFDDTVEIEGNDLIKDLKNIPQLLKGRRGVAMASFALNYAAFGHDAASYHAVNIIIHIINAILAYLVALSTLRLSGIEEEDAKKVSALSAVIFALHPVQTESVTYIIQRMEGLSALFYLSGVFLFIKGASRQTTLQGMPFYAGLLLCYWLGFYSKEVAITMPAVIILYDFFFFSRFSVKGVLKRRLVHAVMILMLAFFLKGAFSIVGVPVVETAMETARDVSEPSAGFGMKSIGPVQYALTELNVVVYYITLLFFPANQNIDYDFPVSKGLFALPELNSGAVLNIPIPPPFASLLLVSLFIAFAFYLSGRAKGVLCRQPVGLTGGSTVFKGNPAHGANPALAASFFMFWFFIVLSPTSSIVPIADVMAEHRLYLPSLGVFVVACLGLNRLTKKVFKDDGKAGAAVFYIVIIAAIVGLSTLTYRRNLVWKDNISLWGDVLKKTRSKARAYNNLAKAYMDAKKYDLAIPLLKSALSIDRNFEEIHFNLGVSYYNTGQFDLAKKEFKATVGIGEILLKRSKVKRPRMLLPARVYLANTYFITGEHEDAVKEYTRLLNSGGVDPTSTAGLRYNLSLSYRELGRLEEAKKELTEILSQNPGDIEAMRILMGIEGLKTKSKKH